MELNRNAEAPASKITDDYRDENTIKFYQDLARVHLEPLDFLYSPVFNFHNIGGDN